ncbi:MAG TPA: Smr/MutS family protein [Novosphingobium sp.]|nr:Smr/MutS family protein [Novosphingobium sp.]HZV10776.1 Smr/MutS family protein [Novosphingobium sp.]
MARPRRRILSPEEQALWARVVETVEPLRQPAAAPPPAEAAQPTPASPPPRRIRGRVPAPLPAPAPPPPSRPPRDALGFERGGLDGGWDKRLAKGLVGPDFTLDLHGATLETAYTRLDHGLALALAQGARMVLLITGRPRPAPGPMDRGSHRGVIRAKFQDWLASGPHASRIAALRPAHPRHGGPGAVYIVLRRAKGD